MSLTRAFTTRRMAKNSEAGPAVPRRNLTVKPVSHESIRHKISAPIELLSTTNMLSYNAPDIYPSSMSSSSSHSGDDSDRSPTTAHSPLTSADSSSVESLSPTSVEPNHLSCYFGAPASGDEAPKIPKRSPSHTKSKASVENFLTRKHTSITSKSSKRNISTSTARSSIDMFGARTESVEQHPFGNELAQVSELAEEYGMSKTTLTIVDEEEQELASRGLYKFCAEEYMSEIHDLFMGAFGDQKPSMAAVWI